ncbi:MAG: glycosyltransferase, partial [Acidimicrobiia bacterium]
MVAAVLAYRTDELSGVLDAVAAQVYGALRVVVVGLDLEQPAPAEGPAQVTSLAELVGELPPDVDLVWFLHGDALPRPDALGALVEELERNEASVAGSKVLYADRPDVLESVGAATDVFGEPYSGLEEEEVDLEQYDVVRDVAFVSGVSTLVRRDLLRGLRGPDPVLAPQAAGQDFSQRARVAGGRVIVVPSSEVLHRGACAEDPDGWHERAGRLRAMLKVYTPITLTWVMPLSFAIGLVDGVARTLLGRFRSVPVHLAAWAWNLLHLPSTLGARRAIRGARAQGDEELFRFQMGGSVMVRKLGSDLATRLSLALDEEHPGRMYGLVERSREAWRRPALVAGLVAFLYVLLAARAVWFDRLPVVGFALPLGDDAVATLANYAGGWNPAGLGSPTPLHPAVAATALAQVVLGGRGGLAQTALTVGSLWVGVVGTARLLGRLGVGGAARYLAGLVLV